ncbi:DUF7710 domain-containing protein [Emticicia agri]|uniref:DUF7710 domain-containing protein n=1 Tax=Emticicia agri TaxID=2492393 RepID=A0A4Q5LTY0_9BACT|nr:hypothetical protein [Emticicia agri]RYU93032.1 hypothetical protein EWM59_24085 [Emticicia agri]
MFEYVFVFVGEESKLPSAIYLDIDNIKDWIISNSLSGSLHKLPINISVYDWSIMQGYFEPKKDYQKESRFIQRFTSASVEHWHYENGIEL